MNHVVAHPGHRDLDEGLLPTLVDRTKDMIIRGSENIYPRGIEPVIYAHAGVRARGGRREAPDMMYGEVPVAFISFRDGGMSPPTSCTTT